MESAAGHEVANNGGLFGSMSVDGRRRFGAGGRSRKHEIPDEEQTRTFSQEILGRAFVRIQFGLRCVTRVEKIP
jgi:hypothetical protein